MIESPQWLDTGWASYRGRRERNEDALLVDGALLAVADGVGGAPRGDLAAAKAVEAIQQAVDEDADIPPTTSGHVTTSLKEALSIADDAVRALAERWVQLHGTATTMCVAIVFANQHRQPRAVVANVGDSRCYLIRDGCATQVTRDQTLGAALESAGVDDVDERAHSIVTSVLGGPPDSDTRIDITQLELEPDDLLLLCTDGISGVLPPDRLASICVYYREHLDAAATALGRAAWEAGSTDNLTAVVARVTARSGSRPPHRPTPDTGSR